MTTPLQRQDKFLEFKHRMAILLIGTAKLCNDVSKIEQPVDCAVFTELQSRLLISFKHYINELGYAADGCLNVDSPTIPTP